MLISLKSIINELNNKKVRYLHWKSNEHLEEALIGETDLDILVDKSDYQLFIEVVNKNNFKKYDTQTYFKYPSIDDFIGFDEETGTLIHLHIHHQLILGKKFIKELHLPIEDYIIETSIRDDASQMKIMDPNVEIIILVIRFIIKHQGKINKPNTLNNEYIKEYKWLCNFITDTNVKYHATNLFGEEFAITLTKSIYRLAKKEELKKISKEIKKITNTYQKDNKFVTSIRYLFAKSNVVLRNIFVKRLKRPVPYKRINPKSGALIVFMGVDGSGKSTLVSYSKSWLSQKMDVYPVYFGSGDGSSSFFRYPFVLLKKVFKKKKEDNTQKKPTDRGVIGKNKKSLVYRFLRSFWAVLLACEKKGKFRKAWKARTNGLVVICDRYPQTEVYGYNDGPLLTDWINNKNRFKNKVGKWEYAIYNLGQTYKPDLIIKLHVDEDIAASRKPDTPKDMINKKIEAVKKINIYPGADITTIDTDNSLDVTKQTIRNTIKEYL